MLLFWPSADASLSGHRFTAGPVNYCVPCRQAVDRNAGRAYIDLRREGRAIFGAAARRLRMTMVLGKIRV